MNNARKFHARLVKVGLDADPLFLRRLFGLCCRECAAAGDSTIASHARDVFELIPSPDTFNYNGIIKSHSHYPSSASQALSFFSRMISNGVRPDHYTFPSVLKVCARAHLGYELHALILKIGFCDFVYVCNALVNVYGCCGYVESALKLFDEMPDKDLVSWSTIISCFVNNGFWTEALQCFQQMQLVENLKPDEVTMLSVVVAISSLGSLELGKWVEGYIRRNGFKLSVPLGTALIDMYSRCGSVDESIKVFDEMSQRNIATWTALINGLAVHGRGKEALKVFYEMKKTGLRPDHVMLRAVLVGCSHSGLVDDGWKVWNSIRDDYNMEPMLEHYGCMVDLLGRAGSLHEALDFVSKMPVRPNAVIWRILLGACVTHNRLDLAEKVKGRIQELDPDHEGDYVLLSNAYGGLGQWNEKANVRTLMRDKRISKDPGYSVLIVDQEFHKFVSGDDSHPLSKEIKEFLVSIIDSVRADGYSLGTTNVFHDIEEEEKENSISLHSEKLAVAFWLLSFRNRKTMRIMKNLRICHDCHCFMKHVSCKFGVEIIIRDRNRFHHFKEGACSCKDYW
ncbi:PREDICTED: pentatricopeptide repeat-containing protein At4g21065-like [Tarenaya hassleriana]|uniref:pentatricopeptide repeat-containing protein At4g21065-like n=1 Tax=Tarenaya hassleriana TaxID=28532 RepID=UPI00053C9637|nr:PREDICTED: pentatricopeptide repeat-containing protein At4g21065-like [Tarenaya hassleriana]